MRRYLPQQLRPRKLLSQLFAVNNELFPLAMNRHACPLPYREQQYGRVRYLHLLVITG